MVTENVNFIQNYIKKSDISAKNFLFFLKKNRKPTEEVILKSNLFVKAFID